MRIDAGLFATFIEPGFGTGRVFCRRQPEKGQEIARHEMRASFLELGLALGIDQCGSRIGKLAVGIGGGLGALCLNEDRPAGAKTAHGVVDTTGDRDQFGGHSRIQIRPAKLCRPLEAAILVQHNAGTDQGCPWQIVGKPSRGAAIFGEVHHFRALTQTDDRECADACARPLQRADRVWLPIPRGSVRPPR